MKRLILPLGLLLLSGVASAQLTMDQKIADFHQLSALLAKNYAPYEWKILVEHVDLYELGPWLAEVRATRNDLEFLDVCTRYIGSLNDGHVNFFFDSDYVARLGFRVDLYDGKVLIDSIDRTLLPSRDYPFQIGDELVSVDGKGVEEWMRELTPYTASGNTLSNRRFAANLIRIRPQSFLPRAPETGETAQVVVKNESGELQTYTMTWEKSGTPLVNVGPVPSPRPVIKESVRRSAAEGEDVPLEEPLAKSLSPRVKIPGVSLRVPKRWETVLSFGSLSPVWALPQGFVTRLGRSSADYFMSGTFPADGLRIGYIRIPDFDPVDQNAALNQYLSEVLYMERNTDGLIVDVMRNPGGSPCYTDTMASLLIPYDHRAIGFEFRATNWLLQSYRLSLDDLIMQGAEDWEIAYYEWVVGDIERAYTEPRGRTGPMPLCDISLELHPLRDSRGNALGYTKPVMVLTDETSSSAAEVFSAQLQDAGRSLTLGMRTSGLGGITTSWDMTTYSEAGGRITFGLMNRQNPVITDEYPAAPYIENIGVRPDIVVDYMTRENLENQGRPFVERFTGEMVKHIRAKQ